MIPSILLHWYIFVLHYRESNSMTVSLKFLLESLDSEILQKQKAIIKFLSLCFIVEPVLFCMASWYHTDWSQFFTYISDIDKFMCHPMSQKILYSDCAPLHKSRGVLSTTSSVIPANTKRKKHVIITSKRGFDVIITCLLRCEFVGMTVISKYPNIGIGMDFFQLF